MLRAHSQRNGHKLADVAAAIVDSHLLLATSIPAHRPSTPRKFGPSAGGPPRRASCASVVASR